MCVKFQLSVSETSRDIKGIVLPAGSVHLQAREWQFDPDSASQRQFPLLPPMAAIRYSLVETPAGYEQRNLGQICHTLVDGYRLPDRLKASGP